MGDTSEGKDQVAFILDIIIDVGVQPFDQVFQKRQVLTFGNDMSGCIPRHLFYQGIRAVVPREEEGGFEVEEQNGVLNILFEDPPAKFVITPNTPPRQVWISALSTSFKLDWDDSKQDFVLTKSGEQLKALMSRLINQQLGEDAVALT